MSSSDTAAQAATDLAAKIPADALASALSVGTARAAAQNQTLGNIRSRTAALLPTAAVSVTFATSVGLLADDPSHGAVRMPTWAAVALLVLVVAIGIVTMIVQWPTDWDFDSGTDIYKDKADLATAQRAAIATLERVVSRNSQRLKRLFLAFEVGVGLLALETVVVIFGLLLGIK